MINNYAETAFPEGKAFYYPQKEEKMTEEERKAQIAFIKEELGAFTKAALIETLAERGIKASEKAKKDILLDMLAESIIAEGQNSPSERKNKSNQTDAQKSSKRSAETKKRASTGRSRRRSVPALTKKRRANVAELRKAISSADEKANPKIAVRVTEEEPELIEVTGNEADAPAYDPSLKNEDFELLESFNNPSVLLTGIMEFAYVDPRGKWKTKTHPRTGVKGEYYQIAAVIRYGSRFVYIPAENYLENYYDLDQKYIKRFIENRQGAVVDFRVISANTEDPERPIYIGSRLEAMKKLRKDNWYSDRARGRSLVQAGSIHEARVAAVGKQQLFVELYGVEVAIPTKYVSYTIIDDLTLIYLPGETEKVMVKSVALADERRAEAFNYPVDVRLSVREAKPDPREKYFIQDLGGTKFRGVVRNIQVNKQQRVEYFVELNGHQAKLDPKQDENLTVVCFVHENVHMTPRKGAIVSGTLTFSNDKEKRMFGLIYHIDRQGQG